MNSFEDYHDYMQSDSSLFCDTFKNCRGMSQNL